MRADEVSEKTGRSVVYERSNGVCEVCSAARATEWQHRKNRSQGGGWEPSNGLHVCSACHREIHADPVGAASRGHTVLSWEDPGRKAVLLRTMYGYGWFLLDDCGGYMPALFDVGV